MHDANEVRPQPTNKPRGLPLRATAGARAEAEAEPAPAFQLLRLFAARMRGCRPQDVALSRRFDQRSAVSREMLLEAARELGFAVAFAERPLASLAETDFPCLMPLVDGRALLVTGRMNETTLYAETDEGVKPVRQAAVAELYAGVVLRLEPAGAARSGEAEAEAAATGEAPERGSPARELLDHMLSRRQRPLLVQLVLATALSNALIVVLPLFIMSVYDRVVPHFAFETLWALAIGVLIAFVVDLGLRTSRATLLEALAVAAGNRLQDRLYSRLLRLELAATPRLPGALAASLQELDALSRIVPQVLIAIAVDLPFFVLMLGLLYYIGGAMVVAPIIGLAVIAGANFAAHVRSRDDNAAASRLHQQRANQLIETLAAIETVKAAGAEPQLLSRWENFTDAGAFFGYRTRHETGLAATIAMLTVQATIVIALIIGVYEVQAGKASIGALAAASLLVGRAMSPMGNLVALLVRGFQLLRTTDSLGAIADAPTERAGDGGHPPVARFTGAIAFGNVGFGYGDGAAAVLNDISLAIAPGEKVGLIGRIGCGKSTLLKLLPRYYQPSRGTLLIDGHDIRQYDPAHLRRHIALMPQETVLLDLSLRDNIRFGLDEVDEGAFERAVTVAGVRDFAGMSPEGYGMRVGPRGERLSGGERASVVLARTLLRDPRVLLLDEPTASMDNELERRILARLGDWLGDRTLVLATHRAPLLALVDRVVWLDRGRIIADGPRDEVLRRLKGQGG